MAEFRQFGFGLCSARLRESDLFVGRCGLEPRVDANGTMSGALAWMFFPEYWGQGFGFESAQAFVKLGLDQLQLARVYAKADRKNSASIKIMQRLGMREVTNSGKVVEYELVTRDND